MLTFHVSIFLALQCCFMVVMQHYIFVARVWETFPPTVLKSSYNELPTLLLVLVQRTWSQGEAQSTFWRSSDQDSVGHCRCCGLFSIRIKTEVLQLREDVQILAWTDLHTSALYAMHILGVKNWHWRHSQSTASRFKKIVHSGV